jgi:hypothetical protein
VTVTIEGKIHTSLGDMPKAGLGQILRTKVKSNFGSGAKIKIVEPGGYPPSDDENACESDAGPISSDGTTITSVNPPPEGEEPNGTDGFHILATGSGYARLNRVQPTVTARLAAPLGYEEFGCEDATITLTIEEGSDGGVPFWYVSDFSVENDCELFGNVVVVFEFEPGTVVVQTPIVERWSVAVDAIYETNRYEKGFRQLVKGYFYKPDTQNVITADVEVEIISTPPNEGSGAQIKANIQDDPTKSGFGSILSYTIESAGDDYLAWYYYYPCVCEPHEYVLPRIGISCIYQQCRCEGEPGPPLVTLTASSCTGSGATGHATSPVGIPGKADGPITKTAVDAGGSGYAVLGRVEPTVGDVNGGSGGGLKITTTLESNTGNCGLPTWGVKSVSVTDGGYNYLVGDVVTFATDQSFDFSGGNHDETSGTGAVKKTTTAAPTLEAQSANGLTFSLTTAANGDTPQTWKVSKVTFSGDPSGWGDEQGVGINTGEHDTTLRPADVRIRTQREEPTISVTVSEFSAGSGASLSASLTKFTAADKRYQWKVSSITGGGGSGYSTGDDIVVTVESDQTTTVSAASAHISDVDEDGGITGTKADSAGAYWRDTGNAEEIEIRDGGSYAIVGIVEEIEVTLAGNYYSDNQSAQPLVLPITVTMSQSLPSNGSSATFGATVFDDPQDPSFGGIKAFTIKSGGSNYLAATTLTDNCFSVEYKGPTVPPTFSRSGSTCNYSFEADDLVTDCNKFSWVHAPAACDGMKITVTPGGTVEQPDGKDACCGCCCIGDPGIPEAMEEMTLNPQACHDAYGNFIANKSCDDVTCPTAVPCCVVSQIIGVDSAATCEDELNGTVLQPNPPSESCDVDNPCACMVGAAIDWTNCPARNPYADFIGFSDGTQALAVGILYEQSSPIHGCGGERFAFLVRNDTKVDFSNHCSANFFCNGGRAMYSFVNCESGEVEVHELTDYYTLHDAIEYGEWYPGEGFLFASDRIRTIPVTDLGPSGGACSGTVIPAP